MGWAVRSRIPDAPQSGPLDRVRGIVIPPSILLRHRLVVTDLREGLSPNHGVVFQRDTQTIAGTKQQCQQEAHLHSSQQQPSLPTISPTSRDPGTPSRLNQAQTHSPRDAVKTPIDDAPLVIRPGSETETELPADTRVGDLRFVFRAWRGPRWRVHIVE